MSSSRSGDPTFPHLLGPAANVGVGETTEAPALPDLSFLLPPLEPGELGRLAQYRILRLLGAGGMGIVFAAEDTHLLRPVALKVMRPELAASLTNRTRFLKEARAAAALTSDHIVTVFQVGQDNDVPFLAMQLLHGEPLDVRLAREPRLPVADAVVVIAQTAAGLAAAHEKELVHRDIKPGNLWLEADRPGGEFRRVRILDLGLVRGTGSGSQLTTAGVVVGTPHYMAPEQASGLPVDARADLFSLGCVAYTMLSGELAFPGRSTMAVLMSLASHTPAPLAARNPAVPRELSALVARMMAKSPDDRPGSAAEVMECLDAVLAAELQRTPAPPVIRASGAVSWPVRRLPPATPATPAPAAVVTQIAPRPTPVPVEPVAPEAAPPTRVPAPAPAEPSAADLAPPPEPAPGRGPLIGVGVGLVAVAAALIALGVLAFGRRGGNPSPVAGGAAEPVVVGVLHSQSGTMAVSENPVVDATVLAVEEVNAAGGVLGRPVRAVLVDGKSEPEEFARQAEKLLTEDRAAAVFGCWTSASRKAVQPVVERSQGLLFYPVQYEGLEQSPRIVYLGPAPNQQLLPAVDFLTGTLGKKRLFLVGSDYVFPRTAHEIIRDRVRARPGAAVVGEAFVPLGTSAVAGVVGQIKASAPDVIVNSLNGGTNVHFFRELRAAGVTADRVPTLSVSIAENEVEGLNPAALAGDYLAAAYFQTVDRPEGRAFVRRFRARFGEGRVVSDPMAGAYSGVRLWAEAVRAAGTTDPTAVVAALRGRHFDGPRARVTIDADTLHTWLPVRIGRIRADGQVTLVPGAGSDAPVKPEPFPPSRTPTQWEQLLRGLQFGWNGKWQAPTRQ
jgi:urea transport system substrate-binding protein